ncbi:MAG: universal stress protein [Desulfococcaceae bacterium]
MDRKKVLIPYNFTPNDEKSLDFAVRRFADDENAEVTLFNAYTPVPDIDVRNSPVMEKMSFNISWLRQKLTEQENGLSQVLEKLVKRGFSGDRVKYLFRPLKKDVARDIIDLIRNENFDFVVLNRSPARITRFFTKSVSEKVAAGVRKNAGLFVVA